MTAVAYASILAVASRIRTPGEMAELGIHVGASVDASTPAFVHISLAMVPVEDGRTTTCFLVIYSKPIETELKPDGRKWFSEHFLRGGTIVRREQLSPSGAGIDLSRAEVDCGVLQVYLPRTGGRIAMNVTQEELLPLKDVAIRARPVLDPTLEPASR